MRDFWLSESRALWGSRERGYITCWKVRASFLPTLGRSYSAGSALRGLADFSEDWWRCYSWRAGSEFRRWNLWIFVRRRRAKVMRAGAAGVCFQEMAIT